MIQYGYYTGTEYKEETKIQIESLKRENTELRHKVNLLEDENKRLKSKIDQNSNNSSQPPSTDKKAVRKANEYNGRSKSERNPGGQTGHKGKTLSKKVLTRMSGLAMVAMYVVYAVYICIR